MANNYYTFTPAFVPGAKVRSDEVNTQFAAVETAFDALPSVISAITRGIAFLGVDSGTANAVSITLTDTRTSFQEGDRVLWKATNTNTGAATLDVDSIGAVSLVTSTGDALVAGDITDEIYYVAVYDSANNRWQLLGASASALSLAQDYADYAQEWATAAEDTLISVAAGGDGATDYSALHWAAKADAHETAALGYAGTASTAAINAGTYATTASNAATDAGVQAAAAAADAVLTAADVVSTNADVVSTNADAASTASDAADTAADLVQTNLDQISCAADAVSTAADAVSTAADAVSTAADAATFGRRNIAINGCFRVAQRGATVVAPSSGDYTLDRFQYLASGTTGVIDVERVGAVGLPFFNYMEVTVTTADAAVAAGDYAGISYRVEGIDINGFRMGTVNASTITISFEHAHTKTGTHCVAIRNSATDRSYIFEYTQVVANTWERHEETLTLDTSGTWLHAEETIGIEVLFGLMCGSTFQTTADTWTAGNYLGTSSQNNNLDNTANFFRLAEFQIEENDQASDFDERPLGYELELCRRYFQKSYNFNVAPATITDVGAVYGQLAAANTRWDHIRADFSVKMMDTPTLTWYNPASGNASAYYDITNATNRTASIISQTPSASSTGSLLASASRSDATEGYAHWTAEAEL